MSDSGRTMRSQCPACGDIHESVDYGTCINRLRQQLADSKDRAASLEGALHISLLEMESLATGKPIHGTEDDYGHLGVCSSSRRQPAGQQPGCVCLKNWRNNVADAESRLHKSEAACAAMREALSFTVPFREFSDEWHWPHNENVIRFRELRGAALASDAGKGWLSPDQAEQLAAGDACAEGIRSFIKAMSGQKYDSADCPAFPALLAAYDAAKKGRS